MYRTVRTVVWKGAKAPYPIEEEYIRQHTKGMSSEESQRFAMHYYGWDDDNPEIEQDTLLPGITPFYDNDEELPFL